ncbi:MAG: hypothetical protein OIF40_12885 [Mangrovicoccus sp.]|nr:hypothetical protein [Mangrovicoccus sp.]
MGTLAGNMVMGLCAGAFASGLFATGAIAEGALIEGPQSYSGGEVTLSLWPDQSYQLAMEGAGELGRWQMAQGALQLDSGRESLRIFAPVEGGFQARDLESGAARGPVLQADESFVPGPLQGLQLMGRFTYFADSAGFEECLSGQRFPVLMQGDYLTAERAHLDAAPAPGEGILIFGEGEITTGVYMEGPERQLLELTHVTRTDSAGTCP